MLGFLGGAQRGLQRQPSLQHLVQICAGRRLVFPEQLPFSLGGLDRGLLCFGIAQQQHDSRRAEDARHNHQRDQMLVGVHRRRDHGQQEADDGGPEGLSGFPALLEGLQLLTVGLHLLLQLMQRQLDEVALP